jgi:hypothetical protein
MTAKKAPKAKPLTKIQMAERKIQDFEYAIYQNNADMHEVTAQLRVLKVFIESENYSKYTAKDFINGILTTIHGNQELMMINAGLEY